MPTPVTEGSGSSLDSLSLASVPGVGPRTLAKLAKINIRTVADALCTLPLRYEDRRTLRPAGDIAFGETGLFRATVVSRPQQSGRAPCRSKQCPMQVLVEDAGTKVVLKWFHGVPYLMREFVPGRQLLVFGTMKNFAGLRQIDHPEIEFVKTSAAANTPFDLSASSHFGEILPIYPLTEGLAQSTAQSIWRKVAQRHVDAVVNAIPQAILQRHGLVKLSSALRQLHLPALEDDPALLEQEDHPARRSLIFDELFFLELALALRCRGRRKEQGYAFQVTHRYTRALAALLPYRLTSAQRRVLGEIKRDMMAESPMRRLVQGDVGSGKTVVAVMAALIAIENGTQAALLAPTEVLAAQHFLKIRPWMEAMGLRAALLTASVRSGERSALLEDLAAGQIHLLVGTHALLEETVRFARLGLAIIDEQHRFGVLQRGVLQDKGEHPDVLVMTATPVPRTLALTLYGDLALSVIDEIPPGRGSIVTRAVGEERHADVYRLIRREVAKGRQAFVVYPLIEASEKMQLQSAEENFVLLRDEIFPDLRVCLLHGRLTSAEKEEVMRAFRSHEIDVLAATTVIEVGIDLPHATVMVVENADRFGLSQLHQLRGRVGRGTDDSFCLLMVSESCGELGRERLRIMERSADGFSVAEADLRLRGPGELLGLRQHGAANLRLADLRRDGALLEAAREEAFQLAQQPDFDSHPSLKTVRETVRRRWGHLLQWADVG
ncbi:MAG: ATP-dependent DNA helicase RecG [bacterium]|nr:ATP-dependent DNA helicase RecG [bacterium]